MKTYHLNIVFEGDDNLVYSYDSLYHLRSQWRNDVCNFLKEHGVNDDTEAEWYPYFTQENDDGEIQELASSKALGSAA
jgi:hypothetical protein